MNKIPPEAQAQIDAFNAEEAAKKANINKAIPRESKKDRQKRERFTSGTVYRPAELISHAISQGWKPVKIEGSHQHFINDKGDKLTIPIRTGQQLTVQPDTAKRIIQKIYPDL